ncbi:MAG: restriction endonuclease [candidate division Zixibacteria bacterium]|nr:restriction endonuclease [candidate division Zixibacteria bacterium]
MRRPEYQNFGLSPNRSEEIRRTVSLFVGKKETLIGIQKSLKYILLTLLLVYAASFLWNTSDNFVSRTKIFIALAIVPFVVYSALHFILPRQLEKYNPENVPGYKELKAFEVEVKKYDQEQRRYEEEQRRLELEKRELAELKRKRFWLEQDGYTFEKNIAKVFERLGHKVRLTKSSGDEGVDIFVDDDKIVQCKATRSQIAPAIVRDLYGTMRDKKAKKGIIVSTGGFSSGCYGFVARHKNIQLWDLNKLLEVAGKLGVGYKDN